MAADERLLLENIAADIYKYMAGCDGDPADTILNLTDEQLIKFITEV